MSVTTTPVVFFAYNFHMTDSALKIMEQRGVIYRSRAAGSRDELLQEIRRVRPKVIVSEYVKISAEEITSSSELRGIVVWGVGYDHVDVEAATASRIYVANTAGSNSESVAEHVFAVILGFSRKIGAYDRFVREGDWERREETGLPKELSPHDLFGKTIGIVGFGAIGRKVSRIAKGFGMRDLAYDPFVTPEAIQSAGAEPRADLEGLLSDSDYVTLHVTLSKDTRKMIGAKQLSKMKKTAYLVNASRGGVLDQEALVEALTNGTIAGAGLDVFEKEPLPKDSVLVQLKNVILTPHCAGNSEEALDDTALAFSEQVVSILKDKVPKNLVNKSLAA